METITTMAEILWIMKYHFLLAGIIIGGTHMLHRKGWVR